MRLRNILVLAALVATPPAFAVDLGSVQLHGFGSWAYGETDNGRYLSGTRDGSYSNADLFLNIYAQPTENLSISAQVGWFQNDTDSDTEFDFAFAEWTHSDHLKVRFGRVKHPWGLYGEVLRVGTIRPFLDLPQAIYGPHGYVGQGYNGIGITGRQTWGNGWSLTYDVYGGALRSESTFPNLILAAAGADFPLDDGVALGESQVRDMIGARVHFDVPGSRIRFGASGYTGDYLQSFSPDTGTRDLLGVHAEYSGSKFQARVEGLNQQSTGTSGSNVAAFYAEAAYSLNDHWQVAGRFEHYELDLPDTDDSQLPRLFQEFGENQDTALGLNYRFSGQAMLKASVHRVQGIRFATPELADPIAALVLGDFDSETTLVQFGAQFSF